MKKLQALLKNKAISKKPDFQKLFKKYEKAEAEFKQADEATDNAKAKLKDYKKNKSASKSDLLEVACAYKLARNNEHLHRRLRNMYYRYLIRLGEMLQECEERRNEIAEKAKKEKTKKDKKKNKSKKEKKNNPKAVPNKSAKKEAKGSKKKKKNTPEKKVEVVVEKSDSKKAESHEAPKPKAETGGASAETTAQEVSKAAPKKAVSTPLKTASRPERKKDNLKKIEGIGPKIEQLLYDARIYTYNQIARSSVARLQGVLDKAGRRYSFADPASWPLQAKMANAGKWEELKKWQDESKGGKLK